MSISRQGRLIVLGGATVLLAIAAWAAYSSVARLQDARTRTASARTELQQLRSQLPVVEQHERFAQERAEITALIEKSGFDPAAWTNRRVQQSGALLTRIETEKLMQQQVGVGANQWFAADHFDVSVASANAGLFTPAQADDRGFNVNMAGMVFFPMAER